MSAIKAQGEHNMLDLQVFEVFLRNLNGPLPIQAVRAHALNGLFHSELGRRDPELVDTLHHTQNPMPFSLAPIFDAERGIFLGFRVGTLTSEMGERVANVWGGLMVRRAEVQLGSALMVVQDVRTPRYPRASSYTTLLADAPEAHGVWLQFDLPMRLTAYGQGSLLPTPRAVWQYYVHKWEAFAGDVLLPPNILQWIENEVHATQVDLATRIALVEKDVEWKGVMGSVEYQALTGDGDVPASRIGEYIRAWQALAFLAEFCGTGEKTTMGMGRTRRVKVFGRHRRDL